MRVAELSQCPAGRGGHARHRARGPARFRGWARL